MNYVIAIVSISIFISLVCFYLIRETNKRINCGDAAKEFYKESNHLFYEWLDHTCSRLSASEEFGKALTEIYCEFQDESDKTKLIGYLTPRIVRNILTLVLGEEVEDALDKEYFFACLRFHPESVNWQMQFILDKKVLKPLLNRENKEIRRMVFVLLNKE